MKMPRSPKFWGPINSRMRAALYYSRKQRLERIAAASGGGGGGGSGDANLSSVEFYADFADWQTDKSAFGQASMTITEENSPTYSAKGVRNTASSTGPYFISSDDGFAVADGDFTLELFGVEFVTFRNNTLIWSLGYRDTGSRSLNIIMSAGGGTFVIGYSTTGSNAFAQNAVSLGLVTGTPYDICLERSGDVFRLYIDGVMVHTFTAAVSIYTPTVHKNMTTGFETTDAGASRSAGDQHVLGIRHTVGVARYDSDDGYTVPAFPIASVPETESTFP